MPIKNNPIDFKISEKLHNFLTGRLKHLKKGGHWRELYLLGQNSKGVSTEAVEVEHQKACDWWAGNSVGHLTDGVVSLMRKGLSPSALVKCTTPGTDDFAGKAPYIWLGAHDSIHRKKMNLIFIGISKARLSLIDAKTNKTGIDYIIVGDK